MIGNFFNNSNKFFNNGFLNRFANHGATVRNPHTHRKVTDEIAETEAAEEAASTEETEDATDTSGAVATTGETEENSEENAEDQSPAASMLDEFQNQLKSFLMDSLGLSVDDEGNISYPGASDASSSGINGMSAYSISAQFELNYSASMAIADANGVRMQQVNFSLSASFEMMGVSSGVGSGFNPFSFDGADGSKETDPLAKMQEMFSPENTAQRILDFALSFFGQSDQFDEYGDTEEGRSQFADYIGAAVQKGFDQAMGILGDVPEETQEGIDKTHELVFDGFDDFVKNGYNNNSDLYNSIQAYTSSIEINYSSTSIYWSNEELDQLGVGRGANAYQALMNRYAQQQAPAEEQTAATEEEAAAEASSSVDTEV